ncbi:hypothetical protein AWC38_SpisGene24130 [Stylophora pistillata]|uniref:EGF-like domain-containing protein n=1 Tax=Stylophora pistillata TaxID=50429 RepID=A0A2B4R0R4_STYPI|nr:hypothetical protein AWC38_SpisGene24130 [Stylophora pistillata]
MGNVFFFAGWTLIARFSNSDGKNWMRDDGKWWYDQQSATGETNDRSVNKDMISIAFWSVSGNEIKITRSDDPSQTPLLETTGNCLGGQTFRSKITSYGDFRNGKVWASDLCLGSCTVQYGGQYKSTDGFQQAECSGNIQSANKIGFWYDWGGSDGSVMMIGGGGSSCDRADHGVETKVINVQSKPFSRSTDIDECSTSIRPCDVNSDCHNTNGSYSCSFQSGFIGNGKTCTETERQLGPVSGGSCTLQYGGQYKSTDGFQQNECKGDTQSVKKIGFWSDWSNGDGSVMTVGERRKSFARADYGIVITEKDDASFVKHRTSQTEYDFDYYGLTGRAPSQSYSLNLWIR